MSTQLPHSEHDAAADLVLSSYAFHGSLRGRLQRIRLLENQAILPIYEAISNSFQSLKESPRCIGSIQIVIERSEEKELIEDVNLPIRSVTLIDDGVGFDTKNFKSFCTPDSLHKFHLGAKGIGRLLYLKAFEKVEIRSVFQTTEGGHSRRSFSYLEDEKDPIQDHQIEEIESGVLAQTVIKLINLRSPYREKFRPTGETIAGRILTKFMLHFLNANCSHVTLRDGGEFYDLNRMFAEERVKEIETKTLDVRGNALEARFIQFQSEGRRKHTIHLCAAGSEVEKADIEKHLSSFPRKIPDADGVPGKLAVYVTGDFLTEAANDQRTAFNLPKESDAIEPSLDEIISRICDEVAKKYSSLINEESDRLEKRVKSFIRNKRPVYRAILPSLKQRLPELSKCANDDELDHALNRLVRESELQSEAVFENYRKSASEIGAEGLQQLLLKVDEASSVRLAQYVARRRAVMFVLKQLLARKIDGSTHLEDDIHDLVFPMRRTSEEVATDRWNLWLLDEGLAFHEYLGSDKTLKAMPLHTDSSDEPDLLVMENPGAFSATFEATYDTITIIEFKRPLRPDVGTGELPHKQVLRYINKIQDDKKDDVNGRPIRTARLTRFFCYLVCDLTKELKRALRDDDFTSTPDDLSYFRTVSNPEDNRVVYYEYLSFDRMLEVAEKRNQVLFDKLGIVPDPILTSAETKAGS